MRLKRVLHFDSASFKSVEKVPVAAGEILKYFTQKTSAHLSVEPKDSLDDMIGTGFIRRI